MYQVISEVIMPKGKLGRAEKRQLENNFFKF